MLAHFSQKEHIVGRLICALDLKLEMIQILARQAGKVAYKLRKSLKNQVISVNCCNYL